MIVLKGEREIAEIREAGRIVALTLNKLRKCSKVGITTSELDKIARDEIIKHGGKPAFKNYKGFPANICVSINEVVVHGIPSDRKLQDGDIISLDVGVKHEDHFADAAITVPVGIVTDKARDLIKVTEEALLNGISQAWPGNKLTDISYNVQTHVEAHGFSVVRAFVGHGIGKKLHEAPEIPNYGSPNRGPTLEPGIVLAIEPMVNAGSFDVEILEDGWTVVTRDRELSAHFEHTIVVTEDGPEILTKV
jgi:methionyl aminopeptidase